jgi:hypothetical protein
MVLKLLDDAIRDGDHVYASVSQRAGLLRLSFNIFCRYLELRLTLLVQRLPFTLRLQTPNERQWKQHSGKQTVCPRKSISSSSMQLERQVNYHLYILDDF